MRANDPTAQKPKKNYRTPEQKRRRQVEDWFTQSAERLREAIHETAPALDFTDHERILEILPRCLDSFAGDTRLGFREWATGWVKRMATITVTVKGMEHSVVAEAAAQVPELDQGEYAAVFSLVLRRLHRYTGNADDKLELHQWAVKYAAKCAKGLAACFRWHVEHQGAVFGGIWDVLKGCADLGADASVAEELSRDVWRRVFVDADEWNDPGTSEIQNRLWEQAYWVARTWKSEALDNRYKFVPSDSREALNLSNDDIQTAPLFDDSDDLYERYIGVGEDEEEDEVLGDPIRVIHFDAEGELIAA